MLDKLTERLDNLEDKLDFYASQIVSEDKRTSRLQDRLFYSPSRSKCFLPLYINWSK